MSVLNLPASATACPGPAAANAIRQSLGDFARHMRGLREDHGVSASKLSALGRLHRAGRPLSATELARLERLQPQSLTRIVAELEANGYIARRQNAQDRRQLDIAISDAGTELLAKDARRQNAWLADAMAEKLTRAERAILALAAELLDRLTDRDGVSEARDLLAGNPVFERGGTVEIRELPDSRQGERTTTHRERPGMPVADAGERSMADKGIFHNRSIDGATFRDCSMARSHYDDVNLTDAIFSNVKLKAARFDNVDMSGVVITDANIDGLTILGHDVRSLIDAELARREGAPSD